MLVGGVFDAASLFLYGGIALLSAGFWVWVVGVFVFGWDSPRDVVRQADD
jgi:hypothetical protein